jgi:hypothetical protein
MQPCGRKKDARGSRRVGGRWRRVDSCLCVVAGLLWAFSSATKSGKNVNRSKCLCVPLSAPGHAWSMVARAPLLVGMTEMSPTSTEPGLRRVEPAALLARGAHQLVLAKGEGR